MDFIRLCGVSVGESVVHWGVPNSSKGGAMSVEGGWGGGVRGWWKNKDSGWGKIELQDSNTVKL